METLLFDTGTMLAYAVGVAGTTRYAYGRLRVASMDALLATEVTYERPGDTGRYQTGVRPRTLTEARTAYARGSKQPVYPRVGRYRINGRDDNLVMATLAGVFWPLVVTIVGIGTVAGLLGRALIRFAVASPRTSAAQIDAGRREHADYMAELERKIRIGELA